MLTMISLTTPMDTGTSREYWNLMLMSIVSFLKHLGVQGVWEWTLLLTAPGVWCHHKSPHSPCRKLETPVHFCRAIILRRSIHCMILGRLQWAHYQCSTSTTSSSSIPYSGLNLVHRTVWSMKANHWDLSSMNGQRRRTPGPTLKMIGPTGHRTLQLSSQSPYRWPHRISPPLVQGHLMVSPLPEQAHSLFSTRHQSPTWRSCYSYSECRWLKTNQTGW